MMNYNHLASSLESDSPTSLSSPISFVSHGRSQHCSLPSSWPCPSRPHRYSNGAATTIIELGVTIILRAKASTADIIEHLRANQVSSSLWPWPCSFKSLGRFKSRPNWSNHRRRCHCRLPSPPTSSCQASCRCVFHSSSFW